MEVGSYTGISLINIIKLIPNSIGVGLDKWTNYIEDDNNNKVEMLDNMDELEIESSFYKNVAIEGLENRITGIKGDSYEVLFEMMKENKMFDFIYIDADHTAVSVLMDAELSWPLLKSGGVMAFDEYTWGRDLPPSKTPRPGILLFTERHKAELDTLIINDQYWIRKK